MDEHSFDDYIKQKIGNFEDPSFDEGAFNEFQKRLSSVQRLSWYKQYRTEIIVISSFILFTLLNSYVMWSVFSKNEIIKESPPNSSYVKTAYINYIDSLNTVIEDLRKENELLTCNAELKSHEARTKPYNNEHKTIAPLQGIYADQIFISAEDELPSSLLKLLDENNLLAHQDGNVYLLKKELQAKNSEPLLVQNTTQANINSNPLIIYLPSETKIKKPDKIEDDIHSKNVSAKVKNELEKHYRHGLGVNIAPHADLVINAFNESRAALSPRVGLTFDWVVSPHLSFETSLDYTTNKFITDNNFDKWNIEGHNDGAWGTLQKVSISTQNLSSPLGLKYRTWVTPTNEVTLRASYTPYYSLSQQILCTYQGLNGYGNDDESVSRLEKTEVKKFYGSSIKLSAGIQHQLKKNKIETSVFYEKSIGTVGPQHNNMQLYGINLAYWFKLK